MAEHAGIVVIGAGQAGATLTQRLRDRGYNGPVTLIGAEPHLPYQRPPLSKAYLLGETDLESLTLRPESFYAEKGITLMLGQPVTAIDAAARTLSVGDQQLAYDKLALVTGSDPIRLPEAVGGHLPGVHVVRGLGDIDGLEPEIVEGARVLIIGGGYIGLEAAAVCAKKGLKVTLIEAAERILQRVAAPQTSDYFRALHQANGVEIIEGTGVERLSGEARVRSAVLSDGRSLDVDFVICGIGIRPATHLAELAGLALDNGIKTDAQARSSDPHIWAAGDCASFPYRPAFADADMPEARIRLESVGNAIDQAKIVADAMLGDDVSYQAKPWFWSDQYGVKLQIAGLNVGYDRIVSRIAGDADAGSDRLGAQEDVASFWYYRGAQLLALDAMNDPRAYMVGKRLIDAGKSADPTIIADPDADLMQLVKRRR